MAAIADEDKGENDNREVKDEEVFEDEPEADDLERGTRPGKQQYQALQTSENGDKNSSSSNSSGKEEKKETDLPSVQPRSTSGDDEADEDDKTNLSRAARLFRRRRSQYEAISGSDLDSSSTNSVSSSIATVGNTKDWTAKPPNENKVLDDDDDDFDYSELRFPTYDDCQREISVWGCCSLIAFGIAIYMDVIHAIFFAWPVPEPYNYLQPVSLNQTTIFLPFYTETTIQEDPFSPQSLAFQWLSLMSRQEDSSLFHSNELQERFALATLVFSLDNFTDLNILSNVCSDETIGNNLAVQCNQNRSITSLVIKEFNSTNNKTTIPPEIELFSELKEFRMQQSPAPKSSTSFLPTQFIRLSKLEALEFQDCGLVGTLPTFVGEMSTLTSLTLNGNQWSGTFPNEYVQLSNLKELDLSNNRLTGRIPTEIGLMTSLRRLSLEHNLWNLTTETPSQLCSLLGDTLETLGHLDCEGILCGRDYCPEPDNG